MQIRYFFMIDWFLLFPLAHWNKEVSQKLQEKLPDVGEGEQEGNVFIGSSLPPFIYCQIDFFHCAIKFCF